jgi:hypothetical protein
MATNYTTKTASLKATTADIRKIGAKQLDATNIDAENIVADNIAVVDGDETIDILTAIRNASVSVGADADGDYTPDASTTKTNRINFMGAYVNVVPDSNGDVNVYIGENNNNPSYSSITDTLAASNYVYESSTSKYALPSDATANKSYDRTSPLSGTEDVKLNDGALIGNILADQTITVTVTSDTGTITYTTGKISEQGGTIKSPKSYTWSDADKGIAVKGTSLVKYANADAQRGFTPNSSTGIFTVTITNAKVVGENGGWYSVSVKLGSTTKSTSKVFVYPAASAIPSVGKPVIEYTPGTTKYISGLAYDSSGSFTLTVNNIANTQQAITSSLNRLALTGNTGDVSFAGTIERDSAGMSVDGDVKNETAVYSYTATKSASASPAKKVSAGITAQAYGQTAVGGSPVASDKCTATTWLYTSNSSDTDLITYFQKDGARKYGDLAAAKSAAGATATYDSEKSLITDYKNQLLVQDGKLMYPNSDNTKRYSGAEGTRYYVRPVKFGGSGQINVISVTVSGWDKDYQHGKTRLYLVKQGMPDVMVLNCFKNASSSYGTPIANEQTPSGGKWTCEIKNDLWQLIGGTTGYYLVVEMDASNNTTVGQITLA